MLSFSHKKQIFFSASLYVANETSFKVIKASMFGALVLGGGYSIAKQRTTTGKKKIELFFQAHIAPNKKKFHAWT